MQIKTVLADHAKQKMLIQAYGFYFIQKQFWQAIEQINPAISQKTVDLQLGSKLQDNIWQVTIISSNTTFLAWISTELEQIKQLIQEKINKDNLLNKFQIELKKRVKK